MKKFDDWAYNKKVRELSQEIQNYEQHAQREIKNNKVASPKKIRNNSQRYLQLCYKRFRDFTGEDYPNPKFPIEND